MLRIILIVTLSTSINFCNAQVIRNKLIGNQGQEQIEKVLFDFNENLVSFGFVFENNMSRRGINILMKNNLDSINMKLTDTIQDHIYFWSGCIINNSLYNIGTRSTICCDSIGWYKFYIEKRNKNLELIDTFISTSYYYDKFGEALSSGNYVYASGYTASYTTELPGDTSLDGYIMKLDTNLNKLWGFNYGTIFFDQFLAICTDSYGNIIAGGGTTDANPYDNLNNAFLVKVDTAGNLIWQKNYALRYKTNEYVYALADAKQGDGSCYAAIRCKQYSIVGLSSLYGYSCIAKLDTNGDTLWVKRFRKYNQSDWSGYNARWFEAQIWDIEVADNGDIIFCGDWYNQTDTTGTDGFICRYTADGDSVWRYDMKVKGLTNFKSIALDNNGFIYGAGRTVYVPGTSTLTPGGTSALFVKLDANGCIWDTCTAQYVTSLPLTTDDMFVHLFPNPTNNELHIRLESDNSTKDLCIYDMSGRNLLQQQIVNGVTQLNVQALASGVYILQLSNKQGQTIIKKFVKE